MFRYEVQSSTISIFSSTGSHPLSLWYSKTDEELPKDSHITIVDDTGRLDQARLDYVHLEDEEKQSLTLSHPVLHIQSPTLASTFIRCPPTVSASLAIVLPWLHLQFRNLGKPWSFEVGLSDKSDHQATVRCSTFQVCSQVHVSCQS